MEAFYKTFTNRPVCRTKIENAEIVKVRYNTWISTKIYYANQIMEECHKTPNSNVDEVMDILMLGTDRLISTAYFRGGLGDGGYCHPRDNIAMSFLSDKLNLSTNMCDHIMVGREKQAEFMANLVREEHKKSPNLPILVLGTAFKAETNINGGSPTLLMCNILNETPEVKYEQFDPYISGLASIEQWPRWIVDEHQPRLYLDADTVFPTSDLSKRFSGD